MKPIDISGPNGVTPRVTATAATPVRGAEPVRPVRTDAAGTDNTALSLATAGSAAPVDAERVAEIRKAIEDDRYPVIPTRIADAMIAAGLLLRTK
ncbi:MAG TPA: flagellar biosynthesis anti-sigma factor FlgM [Croceibacterium sp.]